MISPEIVGNSSSSATTVNQISPGIRAALLVAMFLFGIATTFLLYGFIRMQKRKNISTYQKLVKYLMITDWFSVVGGLVCFTIDIPNPATTFTRCTVQLLAAGIPMFASMGHIIMISVFRLSTLRNLKKPRFRANIRSRKYCIICSVFIWVLTTLLCVLPFIAWGQHGTTMRTCSSADQWPKSSVARYYFPVLFNTLWLSTNVIYVWLYVILRRQLASVQPQPDKKGHGGAYYLPPATSGAVRGSVLPSVETNHGDNGARPAPVVLTPLTLAPPSPTRTTLVTRTTPTEPTRVQSPEMNAVRTTAGHAATKSAVKIDGMILVLILLFNVSCTPVLVVYITTLLNVSFDIPRWLPILMLANNVCNPIVYTRYMQDLKNELSDILQRIKQRVNML